MNLANTIALYAAQEEFWIGVDLDGTLAYYDGDVTKIGKPIPKMLARVKAWLDQGQKVKIFTARATSPEQIPMIEKWLEENGLGGLPITATKDKNMTQIWDDKAISLVPNTGEVE